MKNRTTPELITTLQPNEIFVFGSNWSSTGKIGKLAIIQALKFGANYNIRYGFCGQTYAIPTQNKDLRRLKATIFVQYVIEFIDLAQRNPNITFLVTKVGFFEKLGFEYLGYKNNEVAECFINAIDIPNIHLPAEFWEVLNKS